MKSFLAIILGIALVCESAWVDKVCYQEELGCFDSRIKLCSILKAPWPPEKIKTRFSLYTRWNTTTEEVLDWRNSTSLTSSHYDGSKGTKFIIHGFRDTIYKSSGLLFLLAKSFHVELTEFLGLKEALLHKEDLNVIMVDWKHGADTPFYSQVRSNMRVIAKEVALLTQSLHSHCGANYSDMHLIGHSLGAHIAGFAGALQPGYGRITGLDPAGPGYRGSQPNSCRLDASDALFVDCIHTDGRLYGLMEALGAVDFYPNGGMYMPECDNDRIALVHLCQHISSLKYYIQSVNSTSCVFSAYPCHDNWDDFNQGSSQSCEAGNCTQMGYNANLSSARGKVYLHTDQNSPCCKLASCTCSSN